MSKFVAKVNSINGTSFDMSNDNLAKLYSNLQSTINSKTPLFAFSKKWQNERIRLDNEKQRFILQKITDLKQIGKEFLELKADAIFSEQLLKNLVEERIMLAEQYFERAKAEHLRNMTFIDVDTKLINNKLIHDQLDIENKKAIVRKKNAEAERVEIMNELLIQLKHKINKENLPPVYHTYLISLFLNSDGSQASELEIKEMMKDLLVKHSQVNIDKAMAEVDSLLKDNEMKDIKNRISKEDAGLQT